MDGGIWQLPDGVLILSFAMSQKPKQQERQIENACSVLQTCFYDIPEGSI